MLKMAFAAIKIGLSVNMDDSPEKNDDDLAVSTLYQKLSAYFSQRIVMGVCHWIIIMGGTKPPICSLP